MMRKNEIAEKLGRAMKKLLERDAELLEIDINERTLTHRLAIYVENEFPDWDVDCEYNRKVDDENNNVPKRIRDSSCVEHYKKNISPDKDVAYTVFPDIIVHKRKSKEDNLLAIEVKKSSNNTSDECDLSKLEGYKLSLGYKYAAFIRIKTDGRMDKPYCIRFVQLCETM